MSDTSPVTLRRLGRLHKLPVLARCADEMQRLLEVERAAKEALEEIVRWANAYPLSVFPEPDLKKAHELLKAGGMTLDAISASNMRHVISGVAEIAEAALRRLVEGEET